MKSKLPTMSYVIHNSHLVSLSYSHAVDIQSETPQGLCLALLSGWARLPGSSLDFLASVSQLKCQRGQAQSPFLHSQSYCIQFLFSLTFYDYLKLVFLSFLLSVFLHATTRIQIWETHSLISFINHCLPQTKSTSGYRINIPQGTM